MQSSSRQASQLVAVFMRKSPKDMTVDEVVARLKFSESWYTLGIMDDEKLASAVKSFRCSEDLNDEHWRYGAYASFMQQHPLLTSKECAGLFDIGENDPDFVMGQQIILGVLRRPECPQALRDQAVTHPRTERYLKRHPVF
jgi:hypothetical protein